MAFTCQSVYGEILKWSVGRPDWQRDALRRLIINGTLTEEDVQEILTLCKAKHGIIGPSQVTITPVPLEGSHICEEEDVGHPVSLISISDVWNVNAICSAKPLIFAEKGLTIVYGENGSGKSGYVRILKSVCRAREAGKQIFPNIFSEEHNKPQSARMNYKHGDSSIPFIWEKGKQSPQELLCVNVYDTGCASLYVNDENKVAYMPLGLDVFDKLSRTCDRIKGLLEKEKLGLTSKLGILPLEYSQSITGQWYSSFIGKDTSEQLVERLASFSEEEEERLAELNRVLSEDSKKKRAAELRMKEERYSGLRKRFEGISSTLSEGKIRSLKDAKVAYDTAAKAAELASKRAFESMPLKGIGSDPWRELWKAAKTYSEMKAYPSEEFPFLGEGALCVLCFQKLEPPAKERMAEFKKFIQDTTEETKRITSEALEEARDQLADATMSKDEDEILLRELKEDNEKIGTEVRQFLKSAQKLKEQLLAASEIGTWEKLIQLPSTPEKALQSLCNSIVKEADDLEQAEDPEVRIKLQAELTELGAKRWVSGQKDSIKAEVNRLGLAARYDKAIEETDTSQITKKSTVLTDKHVKEELKNKFMAKLKDIYQGDLKISLEKKGGEKGVTYYQVKLTECKLPKTEVQDIISEGEFHAVALAAFLAEICFSPTNSAIVLDDPVCSLDHVIRENAAEQLVALAKERQVIVFTHDLFFFVTLQEVAKREKVAVHMQTVEKGYAGTGICTDELEWEAMKVRDRIKKIRASIDTAHQKYREGKGEYEPYVGFVCTRFRQTVERAVEEVLLRDIVQRYRRNIYTTNIPQLDILETRDWKILDGLWAKYSKLEHDQTEESKVTLPTPDNINEDLTNLADWVNDYNRRVDEFNKSQRP